MDQLERAAREGLRVAVVQRGNEFIVQARRIDSFGTREVLVGILPITGEEKRFELDRIEGFQVIQ